MHHSERADNESFRCLAPQARGSMARKRVGRTATSQTVCASTSSMKNHTQVAKCMRQERRCVVERLRVAEDARLLSPPADNSLLRGGCSSCAAQ